MPVEYYEPDLDVSSFLVSQHNKLECKQTKENKDTMTYVYDGGMYYIGGCTQSIADVLLYFYNNSLGMLYMTPKTNHREQY